MNERLVRRGAGLAIGLAALMLLLALGDRILRVNSQQIEANRNHLSHTIDVLGAARAVGIAVRDAEIGRRGYVFAEDRSYIGPYLRSADAVKSNLTNLVNLTMGDSMERQLVAQLQTAVARQLTSVEGTVRLLDTLGTTEAQSALRADALSDPMSEIRNLVDAIVARENQLFTDRVDQTAQAQRRATVIALVTFAGALAILLASGAALFFGLRRSYRMRRVLQATVNGTSRAIAAFEKERLVAWNKRFVDLLGKKGSLAAVGTSTRELETAESGTLFADLTAQLNRAHKYRRPIASERTRPDGKIYELLYSAPHDGIAVFSAFDATEKRQSERFLQNAQKMDALGQMTGGIAHDFNNLLTVMLMSLDVMQEDPALQARFGRRMELMSAAAQKGTLLVKQLLAYARKQPLEPEVVDLRELVPGLVELIKRTIGEDVEVRADLGSDLWMTILDPAQFESTILNLALNARDAMPEGGKFTLELANLTIGEASVARQADMATGDYVVVTVMDTGCGMSAEVMARAFEPFFTTKGNGRANGLGLSMVYGFVKQTG